MNQMEIRSALAQIASPANGHIDCSRAVKALCQSLGLPVYWGSGYAIEGDHAVVIVRRGETFGHLTYQGETYSFWFM